VVFRWLLLSYVLFVRDTPGCFFCLVLRTESLPVTKEVARASCCANKGYFLRNTRIIKNEKGVIDQTRRLFRQLKCLFSF